MNTYHFSVAWLPEVRVFGFEFRDGGCEYAQRFRGHKLPGCLLTCNFYGRGCPTEGGVLQSTRCVTVRVDSGGLSLGRRLCHSVGTLVLGYILFEVELLLLTG